MKTIGKYGRGFLWMKLKGEMLNQGVKVVMSLLGTIIVARRPK
jgi:hypothetical protein